MHATVQTLEVICDKVRTCTSGNDTQKSITKLYNC